MEAMRGSVDSWFPSVTSEGIPVYSIFRRSAITGWTVAIGLPRELSTLRCDVRISWPSAAEQLCWP